jgi:hypothetical protein
VRISGSGPRTTPRATASSLLLSSLLRSRSKFTVRVYDFFGLVVSVV